MQRCERNHPQTFQRSCTKVRHVSIKTHQPYTLSKSSKLIVSQCELQCSGIILSL